MKNLLIYSILLAFMVGCNFQKENPREIVLLDKGWKFINSEVEGAQNPEYKADSWEEVSVPHDWAILGEFHEDNDVIMATVIEDGERVPQKRTGRTGGLPHVGVGWYRKTIDIPASWENKAVHIEFDGAMSHAQVYFNGEFVGEWPYGYASFGFNLTEKIKAGKENILAVRLENKPASSRWYPGAGIYRNVRLVTTNPIHVKQWGTYITTPEIQNGKGLVEMATTILGNGEPAEVAVLTEVINKKGIVVGKASSKTKIKGETTVKHKLKIEKPKLWSVEKPIMYTVVTKIYKDDQVIDEYHTPFGFRYFEFTNDNGFFLNGERVPLKGVCLHHDLGPLGAAVNKSALRHRMNLLKEMGCNSIRTSHNPPTPEMLDLADEMGFLVIDEAFDEWKLGKCDNGYHTLWDKWAEKDLVAFIHRDRNHPSVIMWSLGNEIREQGSLEGAEVCQFLNDIVKREDPTRPTTAGFNNWTRAISNGLADIVDVPGWNYKPQHYNFINKNHPEWKMYGAETASTVSSRGEYFFPAEEKVHYTREPYHCSSFDNEFPRWATSPDREWVAQDSFKYMAGEYVWTGFDYLGEPTPYNVQWPSRSSYFGIIDLCGIPKDRFYLYQSRWTNKEVLHLLPHWNWESGQNVSVHCYTSFDKGELFLNGKSLGIKEKDPSNLYTTYRLVWDNITFEPGELKVVALDETNQPIKETVKVTAGEPAKIILEADRQEAKANGKEMVFVTVSVLDKDGNICPKADNLVNFDVEGAGILRAVGNGDPTSLESFVKPFRKAFNGKCMAIIQTSEEAGEILLKAESVGLEPAQINIKTAM